MKILGIDPGTQIVGFGVLEKDKNLRNKFEVIDFGCIMTDSGLPAGQRLEIIYTELNKLIKKFNPDLISVETLFFFKNLKTVMPVSQARGVILLAAAQKHIPVCEFTPLQIKMAITGYGRAEKKQILHMIKEILDISKFDMKRNHRKKDDAIDALAVALCAGFGKAYL